MPYGLWRIEEITGKNPVASEDIGKIKIKARRDAWTAWGKAQGYKW